MATTQELKTKLDSLFPNRVYSMFEPTPRSVTVRCVAGTSEEDKAAIQAIVDSFDWDFPSENLPLFYDLLVQAVLAGQIPQDVVGKAELVNKIIDATIRNQAIVSLASNPLYTQSQVNVLIAIANQCGIALPALTANPTPPNIDGMLAAIWVDPNLPDAVKLELASKEALLKRWIVEGPYGLQVIQQAWAIMAAQLDTISPLLAPAILQYAAAFNVPLAAP